jgi:CDP-glucose 4,6-dehydratase
MRILITGHTGFKGSWLALMLHEMGHEVSGLSLDPEIESHYELSSIKGLISEDMRGDIRDKVAVLSSIERSNPDFIFHLAAQPMVKEGYRRPEYTYEVNVNGALNVLYAAEATSTVKGVLVVTTDKVYANWDENRDPFSESDPLGYSDPYSTSKAMADLLSQSWSQNSTRLAIGIARAGNVIGGGDFGADRLIPDLVRNTKKNTDTLIRFPKAVRPWQHVLDCLYGYILQMTYTLEGHKEVFNFGPDFGQYFEVERVTNQFLGFLGKGGWKVDNDTHLYEANFLTLDSRKAAQKLNWSNKFDLEKSLELTASWYSDYLQGKNLSKSSRSQVQEYLSK